MLVDFSVMLKLFLKHKLALSLIFIGALSWSLTMIKSNLPTAFDGVGFWGANGHDGVWHIALAQSLARGSLDMPVFTGHSLMNYHIGFDLLLALFHSLTRISIPTLYFQIFPPIIAVALGVVTYLFVFNWKKDRVAALWSVFFVYFGGSLGWIVTLFRGQGFGGESMFWSQQGISTLINPPFALSLCLLLLAILTVMRYQASKRKILLLISILLFGSLITIKSYLGILTLVSLGIVSVFSLLKDRQQAKYWMLVTVGSLVFSTLLFLPLNRLSTGLLVFKPFWFLETMLGLSDRLNWPRAYEAIMNWRSGGVWIKAVPGMIAALVIFLVGNLGTRVLSLVSGLSLAKKTKAIEWQDILLVSIATGGVLAPTLFLQQGTPWNTIQFFYYTLFVSSLYAGISVSQLLRKASHTTKLAVGTGIVLLTIPTTLSTLSTVYLPGRPPAKISVLESEALRFLASQPTGVVLTYPYDEIAAREAVINPPRPLYLYDSTAFVSAFSNKPVFLEDQVNLTIMGYEWKSRRDQVEAFLKSNDQKYVQEFLYNNHIVYIYWHKGERAVLGDKQLGLTRIFENKEVDIYKVNRLSVEVFASSNN